MAPQTVVNVQVVAPVLGKRARDDSGGTCLLMSAPTPAQLTHALALYSSRLLPANPGAVHEGGRRGDAPAHPPGALPVRVT